MKSYVFRVVVEEDITAGGDQAYHAYCPALKGCHTWGHSYDEALANIREAVELYVEDLREAGEPIPVDPEQGAVEWSTPAVAVNVSPRFRAASLLEKFRHISRACPATG